MSKGNPLFGQMRGKVGDLVFTRNAGEQVTRSRNRRPKNPQTTKQMAQRAALATCVEFFTRGQRNLFKFAFESKKPGESDYNAFVRANIGNVPVQSHKSLLENGPVFGTFVISEGSLPTISQGAKDNGEVFVLKDLVIPAIGANLTIGQLSQSIIDANQLQNGDILTFVGIVNIDANVYSTLTECVDNGVLCPALGQTKWSLKQFTLDTNSSVKASTLGIFDLTDITTEYTEIPFSNDWQFGTTFDDDSIIMAAVVVSRNTTSGLKVSTTKLITSSAMGTNIEIGMSDEWKTYVAKHWNDVNTLDAQPEDILKGSLSKN